MNPSYTLIVQRPSTDSHPHIGEFKVYESLPTQGLITRAIEVLKRVSDNQLSHSYLPRYSLGVIIASNEGTFFQNLTDTWMFGHNILAIGNDKPVSDTLVEAWESTEITIKTAIKDYITKRKLQNV